MIPFDAPAFVPLKDQVITARVNKIYDGDTITVVLSPNKDDQYYKYQVRLIGIDTPEMKIAAQKEHAVAARNHLVTAITNGAELSNVECLVKLHCKGTDKYGRILAKVFKDDIDLCEMMINDGHANPYDGGTKMNFSG